jgi:hypothetical protein
LIQKWIVTWLVKKFIAYMEPEDLWTCLQKPIFEPYSEPI